MRIESGPDNSLVREVYTSSLLALTFDINLPDIVQVFVFLLGDDQWGDGGLVGLVGNKLGLLGLVKVAEDPLVTLRLAQGHL